MDRFAFRKLRVYIAAKQVVLEVNRLCTAIPRDHMDLVWQIRRAARSIVLNIAEGAGEFAPKEKARIYRIARRSAWETVSAIDLAVEAEFFRVKDLPTVLERLDAVIAMLTVLTKKSDYRRSANKPGPLPRPRPKKRPPST